MADKRISQLIERVDIANNDVLPIVASGATTTNKVTVSTLQDWMQDNLDVGVTSVGLTMPSAFQVSGSPITTSGNITVTATGTASQYIRGDGTLADFPTGGGGGSSVSYYLNGSVSQGTIGGVAYQELSKTPILGAGTDFNISADGYIASFITDVGDPGLLEIPAGNWNFETYLQASSGGGTPAFYIELYKVSYPGNTATLIASNSGSPELIAFGTSINPYFSALAVPQTTLALTDRLALRYYVTHSGRTITLHTENNTLCQVITTFTSGITALNGLTAQVQNFATGTSGTDFAISSAGSTHTFNLPDASASARGVVSTNSQVFTGVKTFSNGLSLPAVGGSNQTTRIVNIGTLHEGTASVNQIGFNSGNNIYFGKGLNNGGVISWNNAAVRYYTLPDADGTIALTSDLGNYVTLGTTQTITGSKTFNNRVLISNSGSLNTLDILHSSGSGIAVDISKAGDGEGLRVVKTSGSGNAVTITGGNLEAPAIVRTGGTSSQYLMADGSVSTLTNPVTGTLATGQVAFGTAANTIGGDNGLFWDNTNKRLGIGSIIPISRIHISGNSAENTQYSAERVASAIGSSTQLLSLTAIGQIPTLTSSSANIRIIGDATWSSTSSPSRVQFETTSVGSTTVTERWRITSAGILQSNGAQTIQTSTGNLTLATAGGNGNILLIPNGTGNVGVGNNSPDAKLVVSDSANLLQMRIGSLTAGISPLIRIQGRNTANTINRYADIKLDADLGIFTLMAPALSGPTINALNIFTGGNVGINTTTDVGFRLDVNGTARVQGAATFSSSVTATGNVTISSTTNSSLVAATNSTTGFSFIDLINNGASGRNYQIGVGGNGAATGYANNLYFDLVGSGNIMTLTSGRNVGIGTASPVVRLQVQDSANTYVSHFSGLNQTNGIALGTNASNVAVIQGYTRTFSATNNIAMQVDGGNVGIGTASPSNILHLFKSTFPILTIQSTSYQSSLGIDTNSGLLVLNNESNAALGFNTNNTERMRITSGGDVLIGQTSVPGAFGDAVGLTLRPTGAVLAVADNNIAGLFARRNVNGDVIFFRRDTTTVGSISVTTTATSYNTSSDYRLKENVKPVENALSILTQLKPCTFNFIAESEEEVMGFLAHEVQEVMPQAVKGEKDAVKIEQVEVSPAELDEEGNVITEAVIEEKEVPVYQGIDHSKLVPLLVASIQELKAEIEALKSQING